MKRWQYSCVAILLYFAGAGVGNAASYPDAYIAGYAAAIVERDFRVPHASLIVQDGVVRLYSDELSGVDHSALIDTLRTIPGVVRVELLPQKPLDATVEGAQPIPLVGRPAPQRGAAELSATEDQFLPEGYLFDQLTADERWPHFSIAYRYYMNEKGLGSTGAANFGETFSLYRSRAPFGGLWEFGLQGGVFSFFDLTAKSKDLVNADYMGGIFTSYRYQDFSTMLRVFHQSSHLGDEFILRDNPVRRVNLSYEQADLLLSYKFFKMLRLYGGGGYLFDQEPADLRPWTTQYGVEIESPWKLGSNAITPIFAGDFKNDEEDHWSTNISLRSGLQFENWRLNQRRLQVLIEYFHGHSPNGQFYNQKVETIGIGLHLRY